MKRQATLLLLAAMLLSLFATATHGAIYHDYYGSYGDDEFLTWEEDWLENGKSHATPPFAPQPSFGGCYISTGKALLEDLDCDKVPDIADNCLGIANPDQGDQNANGLGDACDLVVNSIIIDPLVVMEGRAFLVIVTVTNYRPYELRNVDLRIQVPELGLEQVEYVTSVKQGEEKRYEFYLRSPDCVRPKDYDVVLFVEMPKSPGVKEYFYLPARMGVASGGTCTEAPTGEGKSIINILEVQDIDPEKGGLYPFTIVNREATGQAYVLTTDGLEDWGGAQIQPRSLIVVPAGESRDGLLTVFANEGATGERAFTLTLRSQNDAKQVVLRARMKDTLPGASAQRFLLFGLFIIGAILILAGFFFLARQTAERREKKSK